jgi:alpha-N-acetylglucosaminidase
MRIAPAPAPESVQLEAARALVERVVPGTASHFVLEEIPRVDGLDNFEVESRGGKVVLRGSGGVAIASALNWYLEHVVGVNVSNPLEPMELPSPLPRVRRRARVTTPYRHRYFLNYCTFSYSMAWWGWSEWEKLIDWMALKGVNLPLAITGQEATWQLVLRDIGFNDEQIRNFLVGPAYLPWGWMGNIDLLGGPLPESWIETHIQLERKILARERALGMTPVLQGFTGHVPESITEVVPSATIHQTGDWCAGFGGTWFLDPHDPLFLRMGTAFIERQRELYGTDHHYAADPFNEINPPTRDPEFLEATGRAIYEPMRVADPEAVWVVQAWFLFYKSQFWREPETRALFRGVPDDGMLVLDLYGDGHPVWVEHEAFYGKPWIWNVLYNFGDQVSAHGDLPGIARNLQKAISSPYRGRLEGIGMAMEGIGYNPVIPDFVLDMVWRKRAPVVGSWLHSYVRRRYGEPNALAWRAWQMLLATVYRTAVQTGNVLVERPGFFREGVHYRSYPVVPYDEGKVVRSVAMLLEAAPRLGGSDTFRYDVVNLTRQVLGHLGLPLVKAVEDAFSRRDIAALARAEERIVELLTDLDTLAGTRREFLLGPWLEAAKSWGTTDAERRLYEWNARNIITMWGTRCTEGEWEDLNLYAHKQWQGMFAGYYLPRWWEFIARLRAALEQDTSFERAPYLDEMCAWEQEWCERTESYPVEPSGDELEVAGELFAKYFPMEGGALADARAR